MSRKISITIAVLILVIAVFAWLNAPEAELRQANQINNTFLISSNTVRIAINSGDLHIFDQHEIEGTLRSSGGALTTDIYTGIRFTDLINHYQLEFTENHRLISRSADGYTTAFNYAEATLPGNLVIAFAKNDKPLGTKEEGGIGPYLLMVTADQFGQRWNKFLMELEIR